VFHEKRDHLLQRFKNASRIVLERRLRAFILQRRSAMLDCLLKVRTLDCQAIK
jgi:hypothetical protein